jgi:benzoate-CoA ligase family protein
MTGTTRAHRWSSPPRVEVPRAYNAAVDFVDRHLDEGRGHKVAFIDDAGTLTYAGLAEQVNRAGNALRDLGVRMEQRVLLLLLDSARFPVLFFGAIKIGAVPVPVNTLLTADDYDYLLRDSRASALVVSAELFSKVAPLLAGQPFLEHVIVDGPRDAVEAAPSRHPVHTLEPLLEQASPRLRAAPTTSDDVAFWLYTSGSTGQLKGAVHAQSDLVYTAEYYGVGVLGIHADDRVFSAAKLFFAYGLGNAMTFPLRVGATAILMAERPTVAAVRLRLVERAPTLFFGVPTLYASLLAEAELPTGGALRACVSAGEALPRDLGERWRERTGVDILDGIGSTEMLHIFLSNRPGEVRYGTTGKVVPGYELALRDEGCAPVPPGEVGDLWVSGPSSATHYWNKRELSRRTFVGRWTRTGDHYLCDADGNYVYQGRSDDMLKVGGIYVSPFEVETALVSHEAVLEAAVVGQPDENELIKPKAFVVLKDHGRAGDALADELRAHVKARLAPYKYPRWIEFVPELPKTATGKIQRFKLRRRTTAHGASPRSGLAE